ncbi:MAG TPA: DUF448 domain-containing protein [Candidatus Cloacimonas sp.]|nr:DUF448 domain-containing protein [Candidatus Cloacimonas sp.]
MVCKKKVDQNQLLNFFLTESGIVFDFRRIIPGRRFYLCPSADCFKGLNKWRKGHQKRKIR